MTPAPSRIEQFRGAYRFLSNFAPSPVWYEGHSYRSVEHAYQAAKCVRPEDHAWIRQARSPREARERGRTVALREGWDTLRVDVMRDLVRQKFTHHAALGQQLLDTGDAVLVENNTWNDRWWGVCNGEGQNTLGRLLMEVRATMQQELNWSTLKTAIDAPPEAQDEPVPATVPYMGSGIDGVVVPPEPTSDEGVHELCDALVTAGMYLSLPEPGKLIVGPTLQVRKHPELLEQLRQHKKALLRLLEDSLAYQLFGTNTDDKRFETEVCPECHQAVYIVTPPRRLQVHRLPGNETVCPGSERAQRVCAIQLLDAFLEDCAVPRRMAVLTWTAFLGAFSAWSLQRGFLRPPKPYLIQALDSRFDRFGGSSEERPMWAGVTLTLEQWYGEDEQRPTEQVAQKPEAAQAVVQDGKVRLRA